MEWLLLQGGIAQDVAFVLHVDALVSVFCNFFNLLSNCYTSVSLG